MTIMTTSRVVQTTESTSESEIEDGNNSKADDSDSKVEESSSDEENPDANAAWANSIAKILNTNKPKGKKSIVLSKAKKLTDIAPKTEKPAGYELETVEGEIKDEKVKVEVEESEEPRRKKKRELPNVRVKPNVLEIDRERTLSKIATKGVVKLFNAVRMQQKDISKKLEEAGPLEVRKEKVMRSIDKRTFLDVLMSDKSQVVDEEVDEKF